MRGKRYIGRRHRPSLIAAALALELFAAAVAGRAQIDPPGPVIGEPHAAAAVAPRVIDVDLRELPKVMPWKVGDPLRQVPRRRQGLPIGAAAPQAADPVVQRSLLGSAAGAPSVSFDGISSTGAVPPDPVGAIGPSHYVQMVNTVFAIYDRAGALLAGPSPINSLWAGAPGNSPCELQNAGDPIVLYDHLADRWLLSQFANGSPSAYECIAISRGPDPVSDGFYLYDFEVGAFPDYPKLGVWPDAYYMGSNLGDSAAAYAFDRASMLAGGAAGFVDFSIAKLGFHSMLLPSDLDGPTPPPAGAPNVFHRFVDGEEAGGGGDRLELFEFHVDFAVPANSTFTGPIAIPTAAFASLCNFSFDCIDQPGTSGQLDSITEWPMWRFQYRNFGSHETLVSNHAVDVSGTAGGNHAGIRWFELRRSGGGAWGLHQESTFAPDGDSRWMGSAAINGLGDLAVAYSVSSTSVSPSLRYSGRRDGEALGALTQGEGSIVAGGGSQTGSNRWGDYSALTIDPIDDCTFWFTGEYYAATSGGGWRTRVGSFHFGCGGPVVTIETPADGSTFNQDTTIAFAATATDPSDGDLSAALSWASDLDGALGTGGSFLATLSVGSHLITASVSDSDLNPGLDSAQVEITEAGCSDHLVLANGAVVGAEIHKALLSITAGPALVVPTGASLTLRAGQAVIFTDGFSMESGSELTAALLSDPCS